jgi:hypothetical protein
MTVDDLLLVLEPSLPGELGTGCAAQHHCMFTKEVCWQCACADRTVL